MTALLTGTASLAAFVAVALFRSDRVAVCLLTGFSGAAFLAVLFWPTIWTPETFVASESILAVAATLVAIGAARRGGTMPDVMLSAACLALSAGVAGDIAAVHVPQIQNFAYRGTAFLDLATCAVLATIAGRTEIRDRIDAIATHWLAICFGLSALRLLMFEVHFGVGRFLAWLQAFAWVIAMLGIARQAIGQSASRSR